MEPNFACSGFHAVLPWFVSFHVVHARTKFQSRSARDLLYRVNRLDGVTRLRTDLPLGRLLGRALGCASTTRLLAEVHDAEKRTTSLLADWLA